MITITSPDPNLLQSFRIGAQIELQLGKRRRGAIDATHCRWTVGAYLPSH